MAGFVYVLGNPSMPGLIKVGMTERCPNKRLNELSASTSVPERFELLAYFVCDDPRLTEKAVHRTLASRRVSERREFFRCALWEMEGGVDGCDGFITGAGVDRLAAELIDWIQAGNEADELQRRFCMNLRADDWDYMRAWVGHKADVSLADYLRSVRAEAA